MDNLKNIYMLFFEENKSIESVRAAITKNFDQYKTYPNSIFYTNDCYFYIAIVEGVKRLVILSKNEIDGEFSGYDVKYSKANARVCDMSNSNCAQLRKIFSFMNPSNHHGIDVTVGLGDRLGLASPGHIRLIKDKKVFPVLAQQSIRELKLTGRSFRDVLSAASWAVFQEGYVKGFGADGDHLKTAEEVRSAINYGFTMITLDCSDYIDNEIPSVSQEEVDKKYMLITEGERLELEKKYLGKEFKAGNANKIKYCESDFRRMVLVYYEAVKYTIDIYHEIIKKCERNIDFEMSVDETLTSTSPEAHYFVAKELIDAGVRITSLAPRFYGEFQKGIDYIGDIDIFTAEFDIHAQIAKTLGYKISVHSGSDKFSVFPVVGEKTERKFHLKTAGTNWLEAVRIIAVKKPDLYRKMHKFALENLEEAKKYYHIGAKTENIADIDSLKDEELPGLMDLDDSRQVLHVTYGLILQAENEDGSSMFKDEIYELLNNSEADYYKALEKHIGRHLSLLGV